MLSRSTKVLFDANPLVGQKTGVGYYTGSLIRALAEQYGPDLELVGYYSSLKALKASSNLPIAANIRYKRILLPIQVINLLRRYHIELPVELLARTRGDFVLYPNFLNQPSIFKTPAATVIHDLTYVDLPEYVSRKNLLDLRRFIPKQLKRSKFIITVSEFGKKRIHEEFKVPLRDILVTPIPPEAPQLATPGEEKHILDRLGIKSKFILTLGTVEPRKNLFNMLDAYLKLPEEMQRDYAFVSAGKIGWNCEAEVKRLDELQQAGKNIIRVGYVSDEERSTLYHNAVLFTWASHYEGFGMPILEAMSYGTPCAISDIPVFKEVAENAAVYFDQTKPESITKAWMRILDNPELHTRLAMKSMERAASYNWSEVAASLYHRIMKTLEETK